MEEGEDDENMGDGEEATKPTTHAEDDALLAEYAKQIENDAHEQSCVEVIYAYSR